MEDVYVLSDASRTASSPHRRTSRPSFTSSTIAPGARQALASQRQQDGVSPQTRRLNLRNAGFRGSTLPARRISPIVGAVSQASEPSSHNIHDESPGTSERRTLYGEDLPPSPVNILQEISNSTYRKRNSPRRSLSVLWQDTTATENDTERSPPSWYNENSDTVTPLVKPASPVTMMKLQQWSPSEKSPPLSSPVAKYARRRRIRSVTLRSTSHEASKYIEHLESQLAAANTRIEALTSPTTNKAQSAKLRAITADCRSLQQEVAEWETKFAERVKDEIDHRLEMETSFSTRIRALERDVEVRDSRIEELEWEVETLQQKAKNSEALEITNTNLEKRVDVLTELLAQSPTKPEPCSATASPRKSDPSSRTTRPRSMMPRLPSSPGGVRLSLSTATASGFWHSGDPGSHESISESPEPLQTTLNSENEMQSESPSRSRHSDSMDSGSGASSSLRSRQSSSSRPTSMYSDYCAGAGAWGLPVPPGSDLRNLNRQRKMRRFPSGSCALKPLILPNATGGPSLPLSAPTRASFSSPSRDVSGSSLDPTTSFLSQPECTSPFSTPTQLPRRRSVTWAQEQTLNALEGRITSHYSNLPEDTSLLSPRSFTSEPIDEVTEVASERQAENYVEERSLMVELARVDELIECQSDEEADQEHNSSGLSDSILIGIEGVLSSQPLPDNTSRRRRRPAEADLTPKAYWKHLSVAVPPTRSVITRPTLLPNGFSILTRLTRLMSYGTMDPAALARRVMRVAWISGSSVFGGLGWWLLGLLFRTRKRKKIPTADGTIVEENAADDVDWHQYSAEVYRAERVEQYWQDEGVHFGPPSGITTDGINIHSHWKEPLSSSANERAFHMTRNPVPSRCNDCVVSTSRHSLRLWFHFSLAIVLAVGVAVKDGPGKLLFPEPPRPPDNARFGVEEDSDEEP
ncbi:MAG: hypothetical protein LQ347_004782 [Umbilicaria vellea]|nr:MAG: hypothetical protein LQ347_004782 [Umbilicaria vellea]